MRSSEGWVKARRYVCEQLQDCGVEWFCSSFLIDQMTEQSQSNGSFATKDLILLINKHSGSNFAEWPKGPKKPDQFRRLPLKGLWKAHTVPQSLAEYYHNIRQEIDKNSIYGEWGRCLFKHDGEFMDERRAWKLAQLAAIQGITNRGKRNNLTSGHWLIFSNTPSGVFFLCRAHHQEDDQVIFDRAQRAAQDFPSMKFPFCQSKL